MTINLSELVSRNLSKSCYQQMYHMAHTTHTHTHKPVLNTTPGSLCHVYSWKAEQQNKQEIATFNKHHPTTSTSSSGLEWEENQLFKSLKYWCLPRLNIATTSLFIHTTLLNALGQRHLRSGFRNACGCNEQIKWLFWLSIWQCPSL